jgi:hypothetical protein
MHVHLASEGMNVYMFRHFENLTRVPTFWQYSMYCQPC